MEEENEFGVPSSSEEIQNDFSGVDTSGGSVMDGEQGIAPSQAGTVYNWENAPSTTKAPERKDLNGKVVTVMKADLILPPDHTPWNKTKDGKKEYKPVKFELTYSENGQRETYSGFRSFKQVVDGKEMLGVPTVFLGGTSQASLLFKRIAEFKGININELSLKQAMAIFNSMPKAEIKTMDVTNPQTNEVIHKNLIFKFVA